MSESGSDFDAETSNDRPANDDKDRTLPPLPTSTVTQTTEYTYASIARKAASKSSVQEELTGGKRDPAEVETPGPPAIMSYEEAEDAKVGAGMAASLQVLIEALSFEEESKILGVAPLAYGLCVTTAAGPEGGIVRIGTRPQSEVVAPAVPFRSPLYSKQSEEIAPVVPFRSPLYRNDLHLARKLQAEENELAREASVRISKDAEFAASNYDDGLSGGESQSESESEPRVSAHCSPCHELSSTPQGTKVSPRSVGKPL